MRKSKKRLLSGVLAALMILTTVPVNALEAATQTSEDPYSSVYVEEQSSENSLGENLDESTSQEVATPSYISENTGYNGVYIESEEASQEQQESSISTEAPLRAPVISIDAEDENNYWDLDVVFYDSTVGGGTQPLTSIDWDATTNSIGQLTARTISVQITYRNTASEKDYAPGELTLSVNNLMKGQETAGSNYSFQKNSSHLNWSVVVPANDATHSGFDWDFTTSKSADELIFTNAVPIQKAENFEGNITLTYTLTPMGEFTGGYNNPPQSNWPADELYVDECTHSMNALVSSTLKETDTSKQLKQSNEITFDYTRHYSHPWERREYSLVKTASKIATLEGLGDNADDYTWVKYTFSPSPMTAVDAYGWPSSLSGPKGSGTADINLCYPWIYAYSLFITDTFPEDCVVLDYDHKTPALYTEQPDEGTTYSIYAYDSNQYYCYVGYPKDKYNEEKGNLHIDNTAELHGIYGDKDTEEYLTEASTSLDLSDFAFEYHGDLYRVDKYIYEFSRGTYHHAGSSYANSYLRNMRYQDIQKGLTYNKQTWYIQPTIRYPGFPFDLVIGDDLLYSTDSTGSVSRVQDDDYYFSGISYSPSYIHNSSGTVIKTNQYDCELWIRRAGHPDTDYELLESFRNGMKTSWTFTEEDEIVGFYFVVKDCKEGFTPSIRDAVNCTTVFKRQDIPREGRLHNFSYLEIYRNIDGQRVLQNEPELSSYATDYTQQEIATFDLGVHGHYRQRGTDYAKWEYYNVQTFQPYLTTRKERVGALVQDAGNKQYTGRFLIASGYGDRKKYYPEYKEDYLSDGQKRYLIHGFQFYDLLPLGMELTSTVDEIKESMKLGYGEMGWWYEGFNPYVNQDNYTIMYDENMERVSNNDYEKWCRENLTVTVERNWHNTGRTKISVNVDLSDHPVYITSHTDNSNTIWSSRMIAVYYDFAIPYSSLEDYGKNYTNYVYAETVGDDIATLYSSAYDDLDLNENGDTKERMDRSQVNVDVPFDYVSMQGLTKFVETNNTPFTTHTAFASDNSEYKYRLRVSSGNSTVTNIVIYDAIEGFTYYPDGSSGLASMDNPYWRGSFIKVDTSFAERQGFNVKVYYTENEEPGALSEDDTWEELSSNVSADKVKALAFEYLDENGQPAILEENRSTYVEIVMKAPKAEDIEDSAYKAYNGAWTNWQAIDPQTGNPIDFITGINSNIAKVSLSDFRTISGEKTWIDQNESNRPERITINLLRNGVKFDSTTTSANEDWKYSFNDIPIYDKEHNKYEYSVEEEPVAGYSTQYSGVATHNTSITFNSSFRTEYTSDYLEIYYKQDDEYYKYTDGASTYEGRYGYTSLAGKTVVIPSSDVYLYWHSNSSKTYYGFKVTNISYTDEEAVKGTKVKSLPDFPITNLEEGKYPETSHNYNNNEDKLWNIVKKETTENPNTNFFEIINTYEPPHSTTLKFKKFIQGTDEAWEQLKLDKNDTYNFPITMTNNETGDLIKGMLTNKGELVFSNVPLGTYVVTEADDNYFDFVSMVGKAEVEGITFDGVTLVIGEGVPDEAVYTIDVTNKLEPVRYYEDKAEKQNYLAGPETSVSADTIVLATLAVYDKQTEKAAKAQIDSLIAEFKQSGVDDFYDFLLENEWFTSTSARLDTLSEEEQTQFLADNEDTIKKVYDYLRTRPL